MEKYDFQFKSWPVDFDVREVETIRKNIPVVATPATSVFSITDILAKLLTNSFGKIYSCLIFCILMLFSPVARTFSQRYLKDVKQ